MLSTLPENSLTLEGNRIVGNSNASHIKEIASVDYSIKLEMQLIANKIKADVVSLLKKNFETFDVFEYSASCNRLNNTQYNFTIQIENEGYVSVRIMTLDPEENWTVYVDEYVREKSDQSNFKPVEGQSSRPKELMVLDRALKNEIQSIADYTKQGVELVIGKVFTVFEVLEYIALSALGVHYYHLRIVVDDNASVKVKLSHDILEKSWSIQVEEFDKKDVIELVKKEERENSEQYKDFAGQNVSTGEA